MSWVMFKTKTTYFLRCKHPASFIRMVLFPLCLPLLSLFGRCWKHNTRTHRKETGIFSSNLSVNAKVGMSLMCWRKKASVHGVRRHSAEESRMRPGGCQARGPTETHFSHRSCKSSGVKNRYLTGHPASHKKIWLTHPSICKVTNILFLQEAS